MSKEQIYEAGKSFFVYARSREKPCLNCGYCLLLSVDHLRDDREGFNGFKELEIGVPPKLIDEDLSNIPVAVNNAFGDPSVQWMDTMRRLDALQDSDHSGIAALIVKGDLSPKQVGQLTSYQKLNLVVYQSISGLNVPIEHISHEARLRNIKLLSKAGIPVITYLRPIIPGFNDSPELIDKILYDVSQSGSKSVCYAGLFGREKVISQLEEVTGEKITPPGKNKYWKDKKKLIDPKLKLYIEGKAREYGIEPYRKTSCAASMAAGRPYDYNLHMRKPETYGCCECKNFTSCTLGLKNIDPSNANKTLRLLQTGGTVIEQPHENGSIPGLRLNGEHTQGEIDLARWVSGMPVTAETTLGTSRLPVFENKIRSC